MRKILDNCIEFYSAIEYLSTKNEDDTIRQPTIPEKPFTGINMDVIDIINNEFFEGTNIKCVVLNKK